MKVLSILAVSAALAMAAAAIPATASAQLWVSHPIHRIAPQQYAPYQYQGDQNYGPQWRSQYGGQQRSSRGGQDRSIFGSCEHMWGSGYCGMVKSHANSYQTIGGWNIPRYTPPGQ